VVGADALRLVAITDSLRDGIDGLAERAAGVVRGGATMVQLRLPDESPRVLAEAARALRRAVPGVPLLVVDRADVALATGADGVHVGSDGLAPAALRRVVPEGFIIGVSVGSDDDVAHVAGADYAGIGPVFVAGSGGSAGGGIAGMGGAIGLERFRALAAQCGVPAVAIGGIAPDTVGAVIAAGAAGVAVISALFGAADPMQSARVLRSALDASGR
jgi:thiamine-phosphate pyrophosphorylase